MAFGWLTALQSIPWAQVIDSAPKIAKGAKQLWSSLRKTPQPSTPIPPDSSERSDALGLSEAERRLALLEQSVKGTQTQLQEAVDLINSLAEQNSVLIGQLEIARRRQVWIARLAAGAAFIAVIALVIAVRHVA